MDIPLALERLYPDSTRLRPTLFSGVLRDRSPHPLNAPHSTPALPIDCSPRSPCRCPLQAEVNGVLFYDCPEATMEKRLLRRGETSGRSDDTADVIRKRFHTYVNATMPVVNHYAAQVRDGGRAEGTAGAEASRAARGIFGGMRSCSKPLPPAPACFRGAQSEPCSSTRDSIPFPYRAVRFHLAPAVCAGVCPLLSPALLCRARCSRSTATSPSTPSSRRRSACWSR